MFAAMDEIQLRMKTSKVVLIADAIEQHVMAGDAAEKSAELTDIVTYLRYRTAKAGITVTPAPKK
jgi:hypothetical protein